MNGKAKAAVKRPEVQTPVPSNPKGIRPVYANNLGLGATLTDFTLLFLETGQWPSVDGVQHNEIVAAVTMPPMAAVALLKTLQQYIATFNSNQSEIAKAMGIDGDSQK
jgi:hypothetical protein